MFLGIKGEDFYLHNPWFHAKVGAFVLVGLLSILPTVRSCAGARRSARNPAFVPDAPTSPDAHRARSNWPWCGDLRPGRRDGALRRLLRSLSEQPPPRLYFAPVPEWRNGRRSGLKIRRP